MAGAVMESIYETAVSKAVETAARWRMVPAPQRGLIVREIGDELRRHKDDLGALVSLETGKILAEGKGEVQEMIDIADFAVGLSRQLYGLTMHSERPGHRMYEQWHPLGAVGVITRVQFPGGGVELERADRGGLRRLRRLEAFAGDAADCSIAVQRSATACSHGMAGRACSRWSSAAPTVGERLAADRRLPLISATGSVRMGRRVAEIVGARLGRTLLELGGNNGVIVMADADLDLALRAIVFGAVGTAGQRCTTIRRYLPATSDRR